MPSAKQWASLPKDKLEAAAKSGDADAQFALANWFIQNKSSKRQSATDAADAAMWYRRAAEQGHCNAQYRLGLAYAEGDGVIEDLHEAAKWFLKAAAQGNAWAQYRLGQCYRQGRGVIESRDEAVKWFQRAADLNHDEARAALGRMKVSGETVTERALPAFLAKESNVTTQLGEPTVRQVSVAPDVFRQPSRTQTPTPKEEFDQGRKLMGELKYKEAIPFFVRAANGGYLAANLQCGLAHVKEAKHAEAVKWFHRAASLNDPQSWSFLGGWYEAGWGVTQDYKEAAKWFKLAAENGEAFAQFRLGRLFADGKGVNQDFEQAQIWNDKAAKQGSKLAMAVQAEAASLSQKNQAMNARRPPSGRVSELGAPLPAASSPETFAQKSLETEQVPEQAISETKMWDQDPTAPKVDMRALEAIMSERARRTRLVWLGVLIGGGVLLLLTKGNILAAVLIGFLLFILIGIGVEIAQKLYGTEIGIKETLVGVAIVVVCMILIGKGCNTGPVEDFDATDSWHRP